ncbi:hypothetical protein SynSYN20_00703 [Synechococcus sp. SYN20]|nr:hypothetical protein SynSYN20_00703 [Synechococcus sp. SYN20]
MKGISLFASLPLCLFASLPLCLFASLPLWNFIFSLELGLGLVRILPF